jgi:pimeloyl-ACP methyl ester carboxylesterase
VKKNVYIFSGLGADERVFQQLDFSAYATTFIRWEVPQKWENIENYTTRLLPQIASIRPTLIGLSFGGLIAIEIAKQIETEQVILLASIKSKNEIPFYYRWGGKLMLHKLLPTHLLKGRNLFSNLVLRNSSNADRLLLESIFAGTNPIFMRWAIDKAVRWKNQKQLENIRHIHGTADHIFPFRYVSCDIKIKDGGHLLTLKNADEISRILSTIILQ